MLYCKAIKFEFHLQPGVFSLSTLRVIERLEGNYLPATTIVFNQKDHFICHKRSMFKLILLSTLLSDQALPRSMQATIR